jgi:Family of unknown function (DUF5947)
VTTRPHGTPAEPALPERLRRFLQPRSVVVPGERCEMCSEPVGDGHAHVVNLDRRTMMCTCRGCYLLFTAEGAGRYRAVPDRYRHDPEFRLTPEQWDRLQIPVSVAFFFRNSDLDEVVAFYPSPGGATQSLLDLTAWQEVMAANPAFADVATDVEALLLRRTESRVECYLVPIDICYELVGRVKSGWKGFDGGEEVWAEIDAFFTRLRERSGCDPSTASDPRSRRARAPSRDGGE